MEFFEQDEHFIEIVRLRERGVEVEVWLVTQPNPHDVIFFRVFEFKSQFCFGI